MASRRPDALNLLRQTLSREASSGSEALASGSVKLLDEQAQAVEDVALATSVSIDEHIYPKGYPTRLARSRASEALQQGSSATPSTSPDEFFALDAVVFALQTASVLGGLYIVQATSKGLPRFEAVERADLLAYLTGKRAEWDGVLSEEEVAARGGSVGTEEAGPSTTPPSSPPLALKQLYGTVRAAQKRAYVPSKSDAAFVKRLRTSGVEIVLQNRNDGMHGSHPWTKTADFSSLRMALLPTIDAARKAAGAGQNPSSRPASQATSQNAATTPAQRRRHQEPIILLSNSPTALINMFNVKRLLEEGIFVDPFEARTLAGGVAESMVAVQHRNPNAAANPNSRSSGRLLVVDNTDALLKLAGSGGGGGSADVWNRVVAVFTTGQMWQFKSYHWSEPKELFKHVMGVYVRWHNEPKNANVRDWPIVELTIDRTKRHTDRQVVSHFWRNVDGFVARRKPHLM